MIRVARLLLLFFFGVALAGTDDDFEVVILPAEWVSNETVPLSFSAFGKRVDLTLERNERLVSPGLEIWKRDESNNLHKIDEFAKPSSSCHYLHKDSYTSAAISLCDYGMVHGFVFLEDDSLEIMPLKNESLNIFKEHVIRARSAPVFGEPHIVRRHKIPPYEEVSFDRRNILTRRQGTLSYAEDDENNLSGKMLPSLTVELAVFLDASAYKIFQPFFSGDDIQLLDLLLAYMNNVQALYYHPSLGERIDIALVRLELMQQQPAELAHLDGERDQVLDLFCAYSAALNPPSDNDPRHWDMGLYLSGLDFYAVERGKRDPVTMGLAPVGGVCWDIFACVIAEFGVTNHLNKPYPSTGFTSVYIAAHEIAHNLGMHHDSYGNSCPKDGYIMSPSRGTRGEAQWSSCSREVARALASSKTCLLDRALLNYGLEAHKSLDHRGRFAEMPGRQWTAKRQCELLLRERGALVDTLKDCCTTLKCKSPTKSGYYLAGPALDGTKCDEGKECRAGECLPVEDRWELLPPLVTPASISTGWSSWREGSCESGCIRGSRGFVERRRTCLGDSVCPGLGFDVKLCKDAAICAKRLDAREFTSRRCLEYSGRLADIDGSAGGLQAGHEEARPWVGCAVFCRRRDFVGFYAPRLELNDLGMDPYLPDGTWCHRNDEGENYFCRRHHCLPESFRFSKGLPADVEWGEDDLVLMNAEAWAPETARYFSLDEEGRPLGTSLPEAGDNGEEGVEQKDYVELSDLMARRSLDAKRRGDNRVELAM